MGGDLGGDLGGEDLGGEAGEEAGEDTALLATPGRREDLEEDDHTSHYSKGRTYTRKDGRSDKRRTYSTGPHRRELKNTHTPEAPALRSDRVRTPGSLGMVDFRSLLGLEENTPATYNKNERCLMENTTRVRRLVEAMEKKEADKDET